MPIRPFRSTSRGFTLVELLASIAIASILMIVLLGFMQQSSSTYQETQRAVTTLSDARSFLKFFEDELSSRLPGSLVLFESSSQSDKIGFIRAQSYDEQKVTEGDLQTVIYYVEATQDGKGFVSPKLFRHSLDPQKTQGLIETTGTPTMPATNTTTDEPILYNVVTFKARPKYYDTSGAPQDWNPSSSEKPSLVEVTVSVIDDSTAARYQAEPAWAKLRDSNNSDAKKYVRTYTRTILLSK